MRAHILIAAAALLVAGCDSDPLAPSSEDSRETIASKGKPSKGGTPTTHGISVRPAVTADHMAWEAWSGFTYEINASPTYYLGTTASGTSVSASEYFGCPLPETEVPCLAIDVELSGYAASDQIYLAAVPVNTDPACSSTIDAVPDGQIHNSCAHDTSLGASRRLASLFVRSRATPYVRFGDLPPASGNKTFTFLWQGQHNTGATNTTVVRSFYADIEPGDPDAFRFQAHRTGSGGSSLADVDCMFGPDRDIPTPCIASLLGRPASSSVITPSYSLSSRTETTGKGKHRTTTTVYTVQVEAALNGSTPIPTQELWSTFLHTDGSGGRELLSGSNGFDLPLDSQCHTYRMIELQWFSPPPGSEDYAVTPKSISVQNGENVGSC